jgi:hypothetical protein
MRLRRWSSRSRLPVPRSALARSTCEEANEFPPSAALDSHACDASYGP